MKSFDTNNKPLRIVFVDDDVDLLAMIDLSGRISDSLIVSRRGGLSALQMLYDVNYQVDAVILDLSMPDMDGLTLTELVRRNERLRSKDHPIKIFWFTGWDFDPDDPHDPVTATKKECGVSDIFIKPMLPEDIIKKVKTYF